EEPVARMDGLRTRFTRDGEELVDAEVALARRGRPDRVREIRLANVQRRAVRLRVHGHRLHAELPARADDAHRDLTPVGDQDAPEGRPGRAAGVRAGC